MVLPDDYSGVLTLTLGNVDSSGVIGADLAAKLAKILASIQVKNVSNNTGMVVLSGNAPTGTVFTLGLKLTFASNDWANDGSNASLGFGSYTIAAGSSETAQHLTVTGGALAGAGSGTSQGKVVLTGASTFTWSAGTVSAVIDASDGSGADTLKLTPASGTLAFDGSLFKGFEILTKEGAGSISQSGVLTIGASATLSAGSYILNSGAKLVSKQFTMSGGTLTGDGRLEGNADDNIFTLTGGSLSVVTDLGAGNDRFEWHGGSVTSQIMGGGGVDELLISVAENTSATINLTASFSGFEWLEKSGAGTLLLTVNSDLRLGSVGADYHSLVVSAGTFGVTGGYKFSVGAGGTLGFMASNGESQTMALSSEFSLSYDSRLAVYGMAVDAATMVSVNVTGAVGLPAGTFSANDDLYRYRTIGFDLPDSDGLVSSLKLLLNASGGFTDISNSGSLSGNSLVTALERLQFIDRPGSISVTVNNANQVTLTVSVCGDSEGAAKYFENGLICGAANDTVFLNQTDFSVDSNDEPTNYVADNVHLGSGNDRFVWEAGGFFGKIEGSFPRFKIYYLDGGTGYDTLDIRPTGSDPLLIEAYLIPSGRARWTIRNFEYLTMAHGGSAKQGTDIDLGAQGGISLSLGSYEIKSGITLTAKSLSVAGGSLSGDGKVVLEGASTLDFSAGTIGATVDASDGGAGDDRIEVTAPSAGLSLMGSRLVGFEVLSVQGSYGLTWQGNFAFGSSGYHTLELSAGTAAAPLTVAGNLAISSGATLKVQGLTSSSGDSSLTLTTSGANNTITLPAGAGGLTVVLPDDYRGVLTLTLGNVDSSGVSGDDLAAKLVTLLASIQVKDVSASTTGYVRLAGDNPTGTLFDLVLSLSFSAPTAANDWANDGTTATLSAGIYTIAADDSQAAQHLTVTGGKLAGAGSGTSQGKVELTGVSTFTWSAGEVSAVIDASDDSGDDTLKLTPASGKTLALDGSLFKGFEILTKEGAGSVSQTGTLTITTSATLSAGTYSLATSAELRVTDFTIEGGGLSGAGKVLLTGASTFTWSGGSISAVIDDASDGSGDDTLKLTPASGTLALDGSLFKGFEILTKEGAGSVSQTGTLTIGDSATLSAGTYSLASGAELQVTDFTIEGGAELSGDGKVVLTGASTFTWIDGSISAVIDASDDSGSDTLNIAHTSLQLIIDGKYFSGFEVFTKSVSRKLFLMGTLRIATSATWSKGIYEFLEGSVMEVSTFTLERGVLRGSGKVALIGAGTFNWEFGTVSIEIDASDGSGVDALNLTPASGVTLTLAGGLFKGFELLTKSGDGSVSQSGVLTIATSATLSAGSYSLASGAELQVADFTIEGGSLSGDGKVALIGDSNFYVKGGTVDATVDASDGGAGDDRIEVTASSAGLSLSGSRFIDFEVLSVQGSYGLTWQGDFAFGSSGYHTLELVTGTPLTVAGNLAISSGATLKVQGLTSSSGAVNLTLTTSGSGVITLPAEAGGLTVVLPDDYSGVLTLTLGNVDSSDVSGADLAAKLATLLASVQVKNVSNSTGMVILSGNAPTETVFTLALILTFASNDWVNDGGNASLSFGSYTIAANSIETVQHLTVTGGTITGDGRLEGNAADNIFTLTGGSLSVVTDLGAGNDRFEWHGGSVTSQIMGGSGVDNLLLSVAENTSATINLTASFSGFEWLEKSGAGTLLLTVNSDLRLGSVGADYHGLVLSAGTFGVTGGHKLSVGAGGTLGFMASNGESQTVALSSGFSLSYDSRLAVYGMAVDAASMVSVNVTGAVGLPAGTFSANDDLYRYRTIGFDLPDSDGLVSSLKLLLNASGGFTDISNSGSLSGNSLVTALERLQFIDRPGSISVAVNNANQVTLTVSVCGGSDGAAKYFENGLDCGAANDTVFLNKPDFSYDYGTNIPTNYVINSVNLGSGNDRFVWEAGGFNVRHTFFRGSTTRYLDGGAGYDTLDIRPAGNKQLEIKAILWRPGHARWAIRNFEYLTMAHGGSAKQETNIDLGAQGGISLTLGSYEIKNGSRNGITTLTTLTANSLSVAGGSLSGDGKVVLVGASTLDFSAGTISATVDASDGGDDRIEVTAASSGGLSLTGSYLVGFEVLSVQGSYGLTWQGNFAFGSSGYHTLELSAGTAAAPLTVAGNLAISSGATLKVQGLNSSSGDSTLTLTTSGSGNVITLPAVAGGLTVVLPDDYTGVLTLTLGNVDSSGVSGDDLAAKLATLLASIQVKDVSASTTGYVGLAGDDPTGTVFDLVLSLSFAAPTPANDWANDGTTATLSTGTYTIAADGSQAAQHLTVSGGELAGAGSSASQGKVVLSWCQHFHLECW